ncbi:MAG: hypothetical protein AAGA48_37240 [Myxococcota bacterium]
MTRELYLIAASLLLVGCEAIPDFVSITPQFGYVDGCTPVTLQGSNLGTEATASVGGPNVGQTDIPIQPAEFDPDLPDHAQDIGFRYEGVMPISVRPDDGSGWQDISMTIDEQSMTLLHAWYYLACPASFDVDRSAIPEIASPGDVFRFGGCGLDETVEMVVFDAAEAEVVRIALTGNEFCPTGEATAALPNDLMPGDYTVQLIDDEGTVYADSCMPIKDKKGKAIGEECQGFPFTVEGAA